MRITTALRASPRQGASDLDAVAAVHKAELVDFEAGRARVGVELPAEVAGKLGEVERALVAFAAPVVCVDAAGGEAGVDAVGVFLPLEGAVNAGGIGAAKVLPIDRSEGGADGGIGVEILLDAADEEVAQGLDAEVAAVAIDVEDAGVF